MINATRAARLDAIEDDLLDMLDPVNDDDMLDGDILDMLDAFDDELSRNGDL